METTTSWLHGHKSDFSQGHHGVHGFAWLAAYLWAWQWLAWHVLHTNYCKDNDKQEKKEQQQK